MSTIGPSVRVVDMEAPHFLLQSSPTQAAQLVRSFMRDVQCGPLQEKNGTED